jgi:hypothetical protein
MLAWRKLTCQNSAAGAPTIGWCRLRNRVRSRPLIARSGLLNRQDASGNFTGSYVMQDGSSGTIGGSVRADGGFTVTQFGNPSVTPLSSLLVLQNRFPYCNWAGAGSTGVSGSVVGKSLTITGCGELYDQRNTPVDGPARPDCSSSSGLRLARRRPGSTPGHPGSPACGCDAAAATPEIGLAAPDS